MEDNTNPQIQQPNVGFPQQTQRRTKKFPKWLPIVLIIVTVIVLVIAAIFILQEPADEEGEVAGVPTSTLDQSFSVPTPTPTPTEAPVNRDEISIEILNGTGIPKEASYLEGQLTSLGYSDIEAGNASEQDHTATEVVFGSGVADTIRDEIVKKLEEIYKDVESRTSGSLDVDVQITTGLRKGASLPTATPTKSSSTPTPTTAVTPTGTVTPTPTPTPTPSS